MDYWTSKDVREVTKSHVNFVVADTKRWEQQAAYFLDTHWKVEAFVKNAGLGFAIPYMHGGNWHDYVPDFIVRLAGDPAAPARHLILEVKGFDEKAEAKKDAASRWVKAVNADGKHGTWSYAMVRQPSETAAAVEGALRAND